MAEEEAPRRPRRPSPERAREDDRVRLFGAAQARRAGLDAAALGGADREGAAPRLRPSRGARPGRQVRRPVRAGAARRPGARACPAAAAEREAGQVTVCYLLEVLGNVEVEPNLSG